MRVLLTAFDPYDEWQENSSWLALVELLQEMPRNLDLVTRRYPVDLEVLQERLYKDLEQAYDVVLHLGQSPGASSIKLEAITLNVAGNVEEKGKDLPALIPGASTAFRSELPLGELTRQLQSAEIPAFVSYHAGTFLCNATMYLTHHYFCKSRTRPSVGFMHLPLAPQQVAAQGRSMPSMAVSTMARAIRIVLDTLVVEAKASGGNAALINRPV